LTGRERQIAELVAGGRTNKQGAAALHLREKTVENGLTRIYEKLGVRSRVDRTRTPSRV
jgi:DNA-binding NarL/FixJ family response regulator